MSIGTWLGLNGLELPIEGLLVGLGLGVVLMDIAGLAEKLVGGGLIDVLLVGDDLDVVLNWNTC